MGKKLVIVESPAKAKTINKILGGDYVVESSVGHIRDLPERNIGVDIEKGFKPKYVQVPGKKKVIDTLKKAAQACDEIYLAPDPDREGEAIAWHIHEVLKGENKDKPFYRIQYNEITARAVRAAFEHPGEINMARVDAQQARRVLDRIVGYMVSPMLWRRLQRGLSAGRVQSVALRLVCEREGEIERFVPEAYWVLGLTARKRVDPLDPFDAMLSRIDGEKAEIKSEERALAVQADLEGRALRVADVSTKPVTRNPLPPFITSTLQQAASSVCGFAPKRTMRIAQGLYEGIDLGEGPVGLITYMRTDSFAISQDAQAACRGWITSEFGAEYIPEKAPAYRSRSGAQEAHEAIRPTDVTLTPERIKDRLDPADLKVYRLIWERFVASQMSPARLEQRTVKIEAVPPAGKTSTYLFHVSASDVVFPGFYKVMRPLKVKKEEGDEEGETEQVLPPMVPGENLDCLKWLFDRKETKPPPRFSEAALIRELERNGVGRPSTYAQIIATLVDRSYVSSEKRQLVPTELGRKVSNLLVEVLSDLFDVGFTASMEVALDEIEEGKVEWTQMLADFYARFDKWMEGTKVPPADTDKVREMLGVLAAIGQWAEPVTRGKRTYSDEKFVASVQKQLEEGKRAISGRQLEALVKMAFRYREQLGGVEARLRELGFDELLARPEMQPPQEDAGRKLALAAALPLSERSKAFVDSLKQRVDSGWRLSPAQVDALHRILESHAARIENFEAIRVELGLGQAPEEDRESGPLLEAMKHVQTWNAPTKRGKRVFDDSEFFQSLSQHFQNRQALTPRQRAALKKMMKRYRSQIPGFEELAAQYGLDGGGAAEAR
jgi:DNA topoisomerase-1